VISLGFDIQKGDPTGSFTLSTRTMTQIGRRIAEVGFPMLLVQEGGYNLRNLRSGVVRLFNGIAQGVAASHP
jgi:acetoin utilization deacetylase AcuC-like enzyme